MLTRIRIQGFKSFEDVEVELSPLTVLIGPNAAGKSNFLDALQLLSRLVLRSSVAEAFQPPYRGTPLESFQLGAAGLRGLLEKESAYLSLSVDIRLSQATAREMNAFQNAMVARLIGEDRAPESVHDWRVWQSAFTYAYGTMLRYEVQLLAKPQSGIVQIHSESVSRLSDAGKVLMSASMSPAGDTTRLPIADVDERIHRFAPDYLALQRELASWSFFYFEPRERMREPNAVRETRHIGMMGENLASFLNTLKAVDPADFAALELALETLIPSITGIEVGVDDRGEVELRLREDGKLVSSRVLSEGTLRLLGLLALGGAKERPTLVGFEEPENGVHPRRLRLIAELLKSYTASGDMQMIVTTHSPLLLDALPRESLYVCRKVNGRSRITPLAKLDPLGRETDYARLLDDEDALAVSARVLRGDFDA
jgi:predicted ATPase